jgi:peptidyl-prolyl cis-trans isomerase B (cyclophilin B)
MIMRKFYLPLILAILLSACGGNDEKDTLVTLKTNFGEMKMIFFDETPQHKANFIKLAKAGAYDSSIFHRVIENFMIQGGDISFKAGYETYDEGTGTIPAEFNENLFHYKGVVAAARQGDNINPEKKSSASQFYIVDGQVFDKETLETDQIKLRQGLQAILRDTITYKEYVDQYKVIYASRDNAAYVDFLNQIKPVLERDFGMDLKKDIAPEKVEKYSSVGGAPHLDGGYTVFGVVVEGLDVIDKIAAVETGPADQPVEDVYMTMDVEEVPKSKITEMYGYQYPEPTATIE